MHIKWAHMIALISAILGFPAAHAQEQPSTSQSADMVIWGGTIYTAEDAAPSAEAVAVANGRIIYVGNRADAAILVGNDTNVIDLQGATLYPGFVDAHAHLSGVGARELTLNLEGLDSLADVKAALKTYSAQNTQPVIAGRGWIETHWPEGRFPSRWDLDDVVSDRPVVLTRADGHASVANTAALKAAGITGDTQPPFGGDIIKNALGEPTGLFIDTAQSLVRALVPPPAADTVRQQLATGAEVYAKYGWTGLHNMSVSWTEVEMLEALSNQGTIGIRVYNSINGGDADKLFASGARENTNGRVITRAIKLYMDGALGSRGAALLEPYSDANTSGLILSKEDEALPLMETALRRGIQINMHAIGDRGNRQLLDWFEKTFDAVPPAERAVSVPRWRDEHTQILHLNDIPRYATLGVIPSMQPSHAIGDLHFAPDRLGNSRLDGAYAWASLLETGVIIAGGSDAPVERGDPLIEFYAATARRDLKGFQGDNWRSNEALTREQTLKMFTIWPAVAAFAENEIGSIVVGKKADFTAFNIDLMTVAENEIPQGKPVLTIVDGQIVFSNQ